MPAVKTFEKTTAIGLFLFAAGLSISHVPLQFGAMIGLIGILGQKWTDKTFRFRGSIVFPIWGFYIVWNVLSAALSVRPLHSLGAVVDNEWPVLITVLLYWGIKDALQLERVLKTAFIASTVAFIYAIIQFFGGKEYYRGSALDPIDEHIFRAVGFYGGVLAFAPYAMVMFFISAAMMYGKNRKEVFRWIPVPTLAILALITTFARSVWLSLFGILPLLGFLKDRRTGWRYLGVLAVVLALTMATVPQVRGRVSSIFTTSGINETRVNLWKSSVRIIEAYPILGIGQDNFDFHFPLFRVDGYYDTDAHPHSDYLTVLVSGGIPAGIAFAALWITILRIGFRTIRKTRDPIVRNIATGATLSLAGLLVGSLFQNYYGTFVNCWLWWFVVGLIMLADRLSNENAQISS